MAILNSLLQGSFRGVPFLTSAVSTSGGRKIITYEFPDSDRRYVEDLGLFEKQFSFDIVTFGVQEEYFDNRDDLIEALDEPGPGILQHPYLINGGILEVSVGSYTINEDQTESGKTKFSVDFIVTESNIFPSSNDFSGNQVFNIAVDIFNGITNDIGNTLSISARRNFVSANTNVNFITRSLRRNTRGLVSSDESINTYLSLFNDFKQNQSIYLANAELFSQKYVDLFEALDGLGDTPRDRFILHSSFFNFDSNVERVKPKSFYQREREINKNMLVNSVNLLSLVNAYKNAIDIAYENIEDFLDISAQLEAQYLAFLDFNYEDAKLDNNIGDFSEETVDLLLDLRTQVRFALRNIRDNLADFRVIRTSEKAFLRFTYEIYGSIENYNQLVNINTNTLPNVLQVPSGQIKILQEFNT